MIVIIGRTAMIAAVRCDAIRPRPTVPGSRSAEEQHYRLTAEVAGGNVRVTLDDPLLRHKSPTGRIFMVRAGE